MARNFCLSALDCSEVTRHDLLSLLDRDDRPCFMESDDAQFLRDSDVIYFCQSYEAKEQAVLALANSDNKKLEALAEVGAVHAIAVSFNDADKDYDHEADYEGEDDPVELRALEILKESKLQYEASGRLTSLDERGLDTLLILQFEVIQVLAFLRGGLVMDTGAANQQIVEKGTWVSKGIVVTALSSSNTIASKAGIKTGDVIVCIDDQHFFSSDLAVAYLRSHPGIAVMLELRRQDQRVLVSLTPNTAGKVGMTLAKRWSVSKIRNCAN
ncbi:MAG: hypothetical protein K2W95_14865 [Candidatus Obscuribacterales bacterium]|nr:hypothetical protein [Candidatus Obscuribacterales bacterium]